MEKGKPGPIGDNGHDAPQLFKDYLESIHVTGAGRDAYGATSGEHDDLVVAAALAVWWMGARKGLHNNRPLPEGRYIAYYRVSTARQGASGLGQEAQRQAVEDFTAGRGWELVGEYHEVESGKRHENRPELARGQSSYRPTAAPISGNRSTPSRRCQF